MPNIPKWVWWVIWAAVLLIVLAVLKFEFHMGASGIGISQSLVH
jgi:hypothetical protein